jgi:hypothetical protein
MTDISLSSGGGNGWVKVAKAGKNCWRMKEKTG